MYPQNVNSQQNTSMTKSPSAPWHMVKLGFVCGLCLTVLGACSWIKRGDDGLLLTPKDDYLEAQQHKVLVIPEDLQALADTDPFPIPPTPDQINPSFYPAKPPLPDAIYANSNRDEVRVQKLGDRRWLVIPEPPTTAWPKLKQFLAENGVAIALDSPQYGRVNTQWLRVEQTNYRDVVRTIVKDAKASLEHNLGQDRFLIKVEQGLRVGTTEVHLRHENDSVSLPAANEVQSLHGLVSHIARAEDDMLNEVGAYIAAKVSEQTVSKVALQIGSTQKAELKRDPQGRPILKFYLDQERAWATLGQALENADVEIISLDKPTGKFNLHVTPAAFGGEDNDGFFCRITFSCGGKQDERDIQVQMSGSGREFTVIVLDEQGQRLEETELSQQVLVLIREYAA